MPHIIKTHIIALTGFAGVGKDTVADLLVEHMGYRKLAFADALRGEVSDAFGVELTYLTHPSTKNHPMSALAMRKAPSSFLAYASTHIPDLPREADGRVTAAWLDAPRSPRQIMQWWGTEYRRSQDRNYWASIMRARLMWFMRSGETRFVITDCRFDNEIDLLLAMGALVWQVTRPGIDGSTTPEGSHVSAVDGSAFKPNVVIANSYEIRQLQETVLSEAATLELGLPGARVSVSL